MKVLNRTLNQDFIISSGRLWEALKTAFLIAAVIAMSLLVGQLH